MLTSLRIIAILEGISYLLLLGVTMPLKYVYGWQLLSWYTGMVHGVLFVLYIVLVLLVYSRYSWRFSVLFLALIASMLPFATFIADRRIFSRPGDPGLVNP